MTDSRIIQLTARVISASPKTRWILLRAEAADGLCGVGEASLPGREEEVIAALRKMADGVCDVRSPASATPPGPADLPVAAANSAVDHALWDIAARRHGRSVAEELGGVRRSSIPLYANVNRRTVERTPASFAASAAASVAAGFNAVKIAPFDELTTRAASRNERAEALSRGLARIAAVREEVGRTTELMVDCHWRLQEAEARELIGQADALRLHWIECPLPETVEALPALVRLRSAANARGCRLAGGELGIGAEGFERFLRTGAYDVLMPDVKYVGGLKEMLSLSERFAECGVEFSPHNPTGPICHAASLHVCAAAPFTGRLEMQFDETPVFHSLIRGSPLRIFSGSAALPPGDGLGVTVDEELAASLSVCTVDVTPPSTAVWRGVQAPPPRSAPA